MNQQEMKKIAAKAALKFVTPDTIVGVGSGSTVNCFIDELASMKDEIKGAVAASKASEERLRTLGIEVFSANDVVEVIPMARSYVARQLVALGGSPEWREGVVTDNGNVILDVHHFKILEPLKMEHTINNIAGVVTNGIFAQRFANVTIVGTPEGAKIIE